MKVIREKCSHYEGCEAPLCPFDPGLEDRIWYVGEDVCRKNLGHKSEVWKWRRQQRRLNRSNFVKYKGVPLMLADIRALIVERVITDEQREALISRMKVARSKKEGGLNGSGAGG